MKRIVDSSCSIIYARTLFLWFHNNLLSRSIYNVSVLTLIHAGTCKLRHIKETQLSNHHYYSGNRTGQDLIRVHCNDLVVLVWEKMSLYSCLCSGSYPSCRLLDPPGCLPPFSTLYVPGAHSWSSAERWLSQHSRSPTVHRSHHHRTPVPYNPQDLHNVVWEDRAAKKPLIQIHTQRC